MRISKFNIIEPVEDGILLYNTNSNSILKLDDKYMGKYNELCKKGTIEDGKFKNVLLKGKMIMDENSEDEIKVILKENKIKRFGGEFIGLTIAPTMSCNFRCPYCYEKGREYITMDKKTINKVKEYFIKLKDKYRYVGITWYGGEPLLAFPIIEELMKSIYENFEHHNIVASAVTNGYLLTEEIAIKMKELDISSVQITIDGPPEIHNKRRRLPSGEDTFFVIFNNMKKALEVYPKLKIAIRINVDKNNIYGVDEVIKYLKEYDLFGKTQLYLAPVTNVNGDCPDATCFDESEFAIEELDFLKRNCKRDCSFIGLPNRMVGMCGATSSHSYVIDARGDLYKCWDDISDINEQVGNIYDETSLTNTNMEKWLSYTIENDQECMNCECLPLCMGGCPKYWIKNKKKRCVSIKENASQLVHLIYEMSKQREKVSD